MLDYICQEALAPTKGQPAYAAGMDKKEVGEWIKAARKSRGWTQDDLAERLGLTKQNISHWETAKHDPSFLQLLKIRDLTGYALREVMPPDHWPLPGVSVERLASLSPEIRAQLVNGLNALLAAIAPRSLN